MNVVFSAGVRYTRQMEDGNFKRVTEFYIVPAISFTDAEAKLTDVMSNKTSSEFLVKSIKRTNYQYVLTNEDEVGTYYDVVVSYKVEEDNGKIKKYKILFLIECEDIEEVNGIVKDCLKESVADYEVTKVSVSAITNVIEVSKETNA